MAMTRLTSLLWRNPQMSLSVQGPPRPFLAFLLSTSFLFAAGSALAQQTAAVTLPETVVPAALGGGVKVGDDVVAIGNPLGLTASTTDGVVSGLDRAARGEGGAMSGLIQFDAAVNPGSSGGALINDRAQVVGYALRKKISEQS